MHRSTEQTFFNGQVPRVGKLTHRVLLSLSKKRGDKKESYPSDLLGGIERQKVQQARRF